MQWKLLIKAQRKTARNGWSCKANLLTKLFNQLLGQKMKLKQLLKEGVERQWIEIWYQRRDRNSLTTDQSVQDFSIAEALEVITGSRTLGHSESGKFGI